MLQANADPSSLKEAQRFLVEGNLTKARHICKTFISKDPKAWPPHLLLARIALKSNQIEDIENHIALAKERGAPDLPLVKFREQVASRNGELDLQIQLLNQIIKVEPDVERWHLRRIAALLSRHRHSEAYVTLEELLTRLPEVEIPASLFDETAETVGAYTIPARISDWVDLAPKNWSLRIMRAIHLARLDKMSEAWTEIESACQLNMERLFPNTLNKEILRHFEISDKYYGKIGRAFRKFPRSPSLLWLWTALLEKTGQEAKFRKIVEENWEWASTQNPPANAILYMQNISANNIRTEDLRGKKLYRSLLFANDLENAFDAAPREIHRNFLRQVMDIRQTKYPVERISDHSKDITIAGPERPNGIVLVFRGLGDRGHLPSHVLDVFFAELGLTAIFLNDFKRLMYLDGVKSLGETLPETIDALREIIKGLGPEKPLFTFGSSAGGMAAILYAAKLNGKSSLVFSPPATVNPNDLALFGEQRSPIAVRRLIEELDHTKLDLREILDHAPEDYNATVYVGAGSDADRPHAKLLATMGHTTVNFVEGINQHGVFVPLASRLGALNIIKDAFGL